MYKQLSDFLEDIYDFQLSFSMDLALNIGIEFWNEDSVVGMNSMPIYAL